MTQQLYSPSTDHRPARRPLGKARKQPLHRPPHRFLKAFRPMAKDKPWWRHRYFLAAGWGMAALLLLLETGSYFKAKAAANSPVIRSKDNCQNLVQSAAVLSREQLGKILTVPERSNHQTVRDIVAEPYCQLPSLEIRAGVSATREAYPLAFEPSTWLVMLYEGEEYAGFSFSFQ